ncbi:MAG: ferredoxin [Pseudomonadota bacterium]
MSLAAFPPRERLTAHLRSLLGAEGLIAAGHLSPAPPEVLGGGGTLILIGPDPVVFWEIFAASPEYADGAAHPMDRWSRRVISRIAADLSSTASCTALFPFDGPPWHPFQRWAAAGEAARSSPVAMQVTPGRGLWMSYRGALAVAAELELDPVPRQDPCLACHAPCTRTCPVDAFASGQYDVPACTAHVTSGAGLACREGCLVRRVCPSGVVPPVEQRRFHMAAFLRSQTQS